ncbi:MAG TPA: glycosyltransferase family 2 protein [Coleofasciculaceae cyanobacterium]
MLLSKKIRPHRIKLYKSQIPSSSYERDGEEQSEGKPLVSLVVPAYNEASIIESNLNSLCQYMATLADEYRWEMIIINDGSFDDTGELAEAFAKTKTNVRVVHHVINFGLGQALRTGFENCRGHYVVVVDLDLSYEPFHIEKLLTKIRETKAMIVVASPYMKGGRISNVPWLRRTLSIWANRFLSLAAKKSLATLTGMVRVYDARLLKVINTKSMGMEVNPEIIHKAQLLGARITEIPAHLHWKPQKNKQAKRSSSMRILKHSWAIFFYGFLFRPVMFFIIPSLILFLLSVYADTWVLIHCWTNYQRLAQYTQFPDPTEAVAAAFNQAPHTFIIGGMTLMLAIQLFSLGILAVQSKRYFEEIFYLGTSIYKSTYNDR